MMTCMCRMCQRSASRQLCTQRAAGCCVRLGPALSGGGEQVPAYMHVPMCMNHISNDTDGYVVCDRSASGDGTRRRHDIPPRSAGALPMEQQTGPALMALTSLSSQA